MGWRPGCNAPAGGPTRRSCMTPGGAPTPPRAWRCRPSTAICCGVMVAGPGAAMSTSCWRSRACVRSWTPPASPPWSTGDSEGRPRSARWHAPIGDRRTKKPAHAGRTRPQPPPGRAARPGGAGDRASGQRVDAAALAWPAVPGPGRLPGRRRAHLPRPMDPPHPDMKQASGHPHTEQLVDNAVSRVGPTATVTAASQGRRPARPTLQSGSMRAAGIG